VKDNDRYGIYPVEFPGILYYEKKGIARGSIRPGETCWPASSSEWATNCKMAVCCQCRQLLRLKPAIFVYALALPGNCQGLTGLLCMKMPRMNDRGSQKKKQERMQQQSFHDGQRYSKKTYLVVPRTGSIVCDFG
jgi:hypothetical protein